MRNACNDAGWHPTRKLVVWDGTTDGAAVGILAVAADQTSTTDVLQVRLVPL
ncbi:hypothetical protein ECZU12_49220 [Escherichia coli]|nr:hypothetical protein ECZU12_49220 [Escherichia coli]